MSLAVEFAAQCRRALGALKTDLPVVSAFPILCEIEPLREAAFGPRAWPGILIKSLPSGKWHLATSVPDVDYVHQAELPERMNDAESDEVRRHLIAVVENWLNWAKVQRVIPDPTESNGAVCVESTRFDFRRWYDDADELLELCRKAKEWRYRCMIGTPERYPAENFEVLSLLFIDTPQWKRALDEAKLGLREILFEHGHITRLAKRLLKDASQLIKLLHEAGYPFEEWESVFFPNFNCVANAVEWLVNDLAIKHEIFQRVIGAQNRNVSLPVGVQFLKWELLLPDCIDDLKAIALEEKSCLLKHASAGPFRETDAAGLIRLIERARTVTVEPKHPVPVVAGADLFANDGLSDDGRTLTWGGVEFALSPRASGLIKVLIEAAANGQRWHHNDYLKTQAEFESDIRVVVRDAQLGGVVIPQVNADGKRVRGMWGLIDPSEVKKI